VVKTPAEQFGFLGAVPLIGRIIHDEDIDSLVVCQILDSAVDNSGREQSRETGPIDAAGIEKAVEGIFGDVRNIPGAESHEQAFMAEDQKKESLEDGHGWNAFCFISAGFFQDRGESERAKEDIDPRRKLISKKILL
jgi:hypothetical protein